MKFKEKRRATDPIETLDRVGSLFRLNTFGTAIILAYIGLTETHSLIHYTMDSGDGNFLLCFLAATGIIGLIDAVINDLLPCRYCWAWAKTQRHFILVALAFCYLAQLYVAYSGFRAPGLLLYYLWNTFTILLTAFIDAAQRGKDAACMLVSE